MPVIDVTARSFFRRYDPAVDKFDSHGYPRAWTRLTENEMPTPPGVEALNGGPVRLGIKDVVRLLADQRCIRCGHPYVVGESGEWGEVPTPEPANDMPTLFDGMEGVEFAALSVSAGTEGIGAKTMRAPLWSPCDSYCTHGVTDECGRKTTRWRRGATDEWKLLDPRWNGTIKDIVRSEDEVQSAWRILTVHHLTGEKADCRWWNLTSLCQRCHLYIQRKVVMDQVFVGEHTEWFKPYAAGWYAWKYLGEELARHEVMDRLDELLALERAI